MTEVAAKLSPRPAKTIRYVNVTPEDAKKGARSRRECRHSVVDALDELFARTAQGQGERGFSMLETLLGRPATSFDELQVRNAAVFRGEK